MCTEEQHKQTVAALARIEKLLEQRVRGRPPIDKMYNISATKGFPLNYFNRKHVFLWTAAASLTLDLKDLGSLAVSPETWTSINFHEGFEIFATSATTTDTQVFVRCTDETIA